MAFSKACSNSKISSAMVVLLATLVAMSTAQTKCKEPKGGYTNQEFEYKMMDSDVVALGIPRSEKASSTSPDALDVSFEIRCIFKGDDIKEMISIDNIGQPPAVCVPTNLTIDVPYIVYLREITDVKYVPSYPEDPGTSAFVDEIIGLCEADMKYPSDVAKPKEDCPATDYVFPNCLEKPTRHPEPEGEPEEGNNGNDGGDKNDDVKVGDKGNDKDDAKVPYDKVSDDDNGSAQMSQRYLYPVLLSILYLVFLILV